MLERILNKITKLLFKNEIEKIRELPNDTKLLYIESIKKDTTNEWNPFTVSVIMRLNTAILGINLIVSATTIKLIDVAFNLSLGLDIRLLTTLSLALVLKILTIKIIKEKFARALINSIQ